jgi:hypothetical protein
LVFKKKKNKNKVLDLESGNPVTKVQLGPSTLPFRLGFGKNQVLDLKPRNHVNRVKLNPFL